MVSKRKFFSIATMMFVLFFLFQFSMVLRDSRNTYDVNSSLAEKKADGENQWTPSDSNSTTVIGADSSVVFVGNEDGDMGTAVSRWCTYAKRKLISCKSVRTYKSDDKNLPEMMILESEKYADGDNLTTLETLEKKGVIIVFGCLENVKNIQNNKALMKFLWDSESCCRGNASCRCEAV